MGGDALAERLFVQPERWGWEYVAPAPMSESPDAQDPPVWEEPPPLDVSELEGKVALGRSRMPKALGITAVLSLLAAVGSAAAGAAVLVVGVVVAYVSPVLLPSQKIKSIKAQAVAQRNSQFARFQTEQRQRQARIAEHEEAERARQAAALLWHPIDLRSGPSRVDVFGGTGDGWASMLATLGSSLVHSGERVTVLDFTEQDVAGGLAAFVAGRGGHVTHVDLPTDTARFDLLGGVPAEEVAEFLAQAVHMMRQSEANTDLRALEADLLSAVTSRLEQPVTFGRVVAGLEVLRRTHDFAADGPLSAAELTGLASAVDTVGQSERAQQELQFLISTLNLLTKDDQVAAARPLSLWGTTGLSVITTSSRQARHKEALDQVVFHRLVHDMRVDRETDGIDVLVVAGADKVGLEGLETLAGQCRRAGVRLILLLERLRGEMKELLGSSDSAAVLMRLGNAQDASAAAEFIGRGHKVVLSQVTAQVGKTFTAGTGRTTGVTEGTSETTGTSTTRGTTMSRNVGVSSSGRARSRLDQTRSSGMSASTSKSVTKSHSLTTSRSQSWQDTVNQSVADSTTDGTTHARVYEFTVEPTTIQSLPPTAFILIENPSTGRRVVVGDCNPGITLLDRVAPAALTV